MHPNLAVDNRTAAVVVVDFRYIAAVVVVDSRCIAAVVVVDNSAEDTAAEFAVVEYFAEEAYQASVLEHTQKHATARSLDAWLKVAFLFQKNVLKNINDGISRRNFKSFVFWRC